MSTEPQKIISLQANNFKVLKALSVDANGDSVVITGENGAGKSTALNAIQYALSGGRSFTKVNKLINENAKEAVEAGEDRSDIIIETDDFVVTRWWTANNKTYIKVESKELGEISSAQSLLDKFYSSLNFDPISIADKDPEEQRELLLDYLDVKTEYYKLDVEYDELYKERRDVGRDKKKAEARLESLEDPGEDIEDRVDLKEVYEELEEAREHNKKLENLKGREEANAQKTERKLEAKEDLEEQIKKLQERLESVEKDLEHLNEEDEKIRKEIEEFEEKPTEELEDKIENAQEINKKNDKREEYLEAKEEAEKYATDYEELTADLEELEEKKAELLESDKLPLEGLSIGEDGLEYNGFALNECSTAERIKVGIGILVAKDPVLRAFTIRDASVLDEENVKLINRLCEEHNLQAFYESTKDLNDGLPVVKIVDGESEEV